MKKVYPETKLAYVTSRAAYMDSRIGLTDNPTYEANLICGLLCGGDQLYVLFTISPDYINQLAANLRRRAK